MKLMELYDQIQSPIDDDDVIRKLINAYASMSSGAYYNQLVKMTEKKYTRGEYYIRDRDRFYAMLFNKWKNSILAMTKEEFIPLYRQGSFDKDFVKMRNYLINIPDVSTKKEADEILYGKKEDKELENAFEKYRWQSLGEYSSWVHVCSRYLTAKRDQYPKIEHRLYLNTESVDTYKMITYFVEKCDEHHLPYYFKFDEYGDRDDTIVIYTSTENLTKYLEILREIKMEHPDLVSRAKEPPILTGKIDGWIGYASEPSKTPDGRNHSFNEIRANALESSIDRVTKQWIMAHRLTQINYQGQVITFQDYMAIMAAEKLISRLESNYLLIERYEKNAAKRQNRVYNSTVVVERVGYTLQDIRSSLFRQHVYEILKSKMPDALLKACSDSHAEFDDIIINLRNGYKVRFTSHDLQIVVQETSAKIAKNDPTFISAVRAEIKRTASSYGIYSEKYCFDIRAIERMRAVDRLQGPEKSQSSEKPQATESPQTSEKAQVSERPSPQISENPQVSERPSPQISENPQVSETPSIQPELPRTQRFIREAFSQDLQKMIDEMRRSMPPGERDDSQKK